MSRILLGAWAAGLGLLLSGVGAAAAQAQGATHVGNAHRQRRRGQTGLPPLLCGLSRPRRRRQRGERAMDRPQAPGFHRRRVQVPLDADRNASYR